jgi:hypothetical protein
MVNGGKAALERLLDTPAGKRFVAAAEREAQASEEAVGARSRFADAIANARRRKAEELPRLQEAVDAAEAELHAARERVKAAQQRVASANHAYLDLAGDLSVAIEHAQKELRGTCDPRIRNTIDALEEARRVWSLGTYSRLVKWTEEEVLVDPHPSDPDLCAHLVHGMKYRMKRRGSNRVAVEDLRQALEKAIAEAHALALVADAPADLDKQLARLEAAAGPFDPPEMTWIEPRPPQWDENGEAL